MNLLLIGCGRIGRLFLEQWASNPDIKQVWVVQPSLSEALYYEAYPHIHFVKNVSKLPEFFLPEVVIIAVKPQQIPVALEDYRIYREHVVFISLAAGVTVDSLKQYLGEQAIVTRVMPNIAIKVHESLNLAFVSEHSPENTLSFVETICKGSGHFMRLGQEEALDLLTVISGSGPAYFFLLMEALIQNAARQCGVDEEAAAMIVKQTFIGSALLFRENQKADPEDLRHQVSSKGGVTEVAIEALREPLFSGMEKAIEKGIKRIRELAS